MTPIGSADAVPRDHPLQCRCATLRGRVLLPAPAARAVCYCRDCRAYTRFIDRADLLDAAGGSDIVALPPSRLVFDAGLDVLACMSLSPRGTLRWYAACCRTPIGNTPRERSLPYVGVVTDCLATQPVAPAFGAAVARVNTQSALTPVAATPLATAVAVARIVRGVAGTKLSGRTRDNPFFDRASGAPIRSPQVLTRDERARLADPA